MAIRLHDCPYCQCGTAPEGPMHVNPDAPFYGLVVLVDQAIRESYRRPDAGRAKPHGRQLDRNGDDS